VPPPGPGPLSAFFDAPSRQPGAPAMLGHGCERAGRGGGLSLPTFARLPGLGSAEVQVLTSDFWCKRLTIEAIPTRIS
jgi:hypothetical protein